jgi:hypothetical protein
MDSHSVAAFDDGHRCSYLELGVSLEPFVEGRVQVTGELLYRWWRFADLKTNPTSAHFDSVNRVLFSHRCRLLPVVTFNFLGLRDRTRIVGHVDTHGHCVDRFDQ